MVAEQVRAGLDVVTDGELGKVSFLTYVKDRLAGFDGGAGERLMPPSWQVEIDAFPEYYADYLGKYKDQVSPMTTMVCTGPISYTGHAQLRPTSTNLRAAPGRARRSPRRSCPRPAPAGSAATSTTRRHTDYLAAVAEALREEYLAIVEAGFLLQVDDPWLIEYLSENPATTPEQRRADAERHIEILNHALRGIPTEKIRLHTCYGLNHGPRIHDLDFREIAPLMLKVNAGAYSFEVANPRHQHEWKIWRDIPLPEGKILIPGLLGHATNYVEHPELIADQIELYAGIVGRENVHRRGRLRLLLAGQLPPGGAPDRGLGEVPGAGRGGASGFAATLALTAAAVASRPCHQQRRMRSIAMTADEVDVFLAEQRTCRVATVGPDGPHATPLWFVWHAGALWLTSLVRSQRWADLRRDPRIAAVVDAGERYAELRGVELRGRVEVVGEVPRTGEPVPELDGPGAGVRRQVRRPRAGARRPARLAAADPEKITSWDFRKLPDSAQRYSGADR